MQIKEILQKYNLPYECQVETKNLIQAISLDKKNINNSLSVVLLKEIEIVMFIKQIKNFY